MRAGYHTDVGDVGRAAADKFQTVGKGKDGGVLLDDDHIEERRTFRRLLDEITVSQREGIAVHHRRRRGRAVFPPQSFERAAIVLHPRRSALHQHGAAGGREFTEAEAGETLRHLWLCIDKKVIKAVLAGGAHQRRDDRAREPRLLPPRIGGHHLDHGAGEAGRGDDIFIAVLGDGGIVGRALEDKAAALQQPFDGSSFITAEFARYAAVKSKHF